MEVNDDRLELPVSNSRYSSCTAPGRMKAAATMAMGSLVLNCTGPRVPVHGLIIQYQVESLWWLAIFVLFVCLFVVHAKYDHNDVAHDHQGIMNTVLCLARFPML
jgi:hypothetical protein